MSDVFFIILSLTILGWVFAAPFVYVRHMSWRESIFMRRMAAVIGFKYERDGDMASVSASILQQERDLDQGKIFDVLTGAYKGISMRIFTCRFFVWEGKSGHWSFGTVFEISSEAKLPDIILRPRVQEGLFADDSPMRNFVPFSDYEKVNLEGDFDEYFTLYAAKNAHIEALEIFQPDMMAAMIDRYRSCGLEFTGNKYYVFPGGLIRDDDNFLATLALVERIHEECLPTLQSMAAGSLH